MGGIMVGNAIPEETAKNKTPRSPPRKRALGRLRARHRRGRPLLRWARTVPASRPGRQPTLDPAPRDRWAAIRARSRRVPASLAEGGADPSLREPADRTRRRRSARRQARRHGSSDLRRRSRTRAGAEALRMAQSEARPRLAGEPGAVRVPSVRAAPRLECHERRRPRGPGPDLAREAGDGSTGSPAHRRRDAMGCGHGVPGRQPVRTGRRNARAPARRSPTHACSAPCGGRQRRGDRPGVGSDRRGQAGVRVPGADGGAVRRGTAGALGRDRPRRRGVDRPPPTA